MASNNPSYSSEGETDEEDQDYDPNNSEEEDEEGPVFVSGAAQAELHVDENYLQFLGQFYPYVVPHLMGEVAGEVQVEEPTDEESEVEVVEIPEDTEHGIEEAEEDRNRGGINGVGGRECEGSSGVERPSGSQSDRSVYPNCPVCLEPWSSDGVHRACCIPCGHVYGRSCLEKWVHRCGRNNGKCPQCNRKFKPKDIINLYAPQIVIPNEDLEKELRSLRATNESLKFENDNLLEEIRKYKKHERDRETFDRQKKACLQHESGAMRGLFNCFGDRCSSAQTLSEHSFVSQNAGQGGFLHCNFVLQNELEVDGARVLGIDASSQILIISRKAPGGGGEHVLSKISLLFPNEMGNIQLPSNTGAIRDLCISPQGTTLPGRLALMASLGKKLSILSMESNNVVLKYDLPVPAWSCSWDFNSPHHIYAGLQNGMLLVFDLRQTSAPMESMEGLSRHPVHTIHSIVHNDSTRKVFSASSVGPCLWDVRGSGERPFLIPGMENQGVCISLACGSSGEDIVASFRPKLELSNDYIFSQPSSSPSPTVSGSRKLGSHVYVKRVDGACYREPKVAHGNVSEVRMSKSAILCMEGNNPLFAYGDEAFHGVCVWDMPSFQVVRRLKPHRHPILDLKYACSAGPGFLGCISEDRLQVFTCSEV